MRAAELRERMRRIEARLDLEARVRKALEHAETEEEAVEVAARALHGAFGPTLALLTSDSTGSRLRPTHHDSEAVAVIEPETCLALVTSATILTATNRAFDACGHLRSAPGPTSGVCVPICAAGETFGVIQWSGPDHELLDEVGIGGLEAIAHMLAMRLSLLRASASVGEVESPRTDPLTGLLNPYSTQLAIRDLVRDLIPFSVSVCDLDEFSSFNEAHGHDAGDRALRLFAQVLSATIRPNDIAGRTAGDQFTVVFPATSALDAAHALERVRENLALALTESDVVAFTASYGVADSNQGDSIEELIETAEVAVALAKRGGCNRVVVAGEETLQSPEPDEA